MSRSLADVAAEFYATHKEEYKYGLNVPSLFLEIEDIEEVEENIVGQTRWDTQYETVYEFEGRFWRVHYQAPSTEYGEWDEAEPENYEIEEVTRVTKTVHVWAPIARAQK